MENLTFVLNLMLFISLTLFNPILQKLFNIKMIFNFIFSFFKFSEIGKLVKHYFFKSV